MINLISQDPPKCVDIDGHSYPVVTDFKSWLNFIALSKDPEIEPAIALEIMLDMYTDRVPQDIEKAVSGLNNFLIGAVYDSKGGGSNKTIDVQVIDYTRDSGLILAAFLETYGINLIKTDLHWWVFLALLSGISKDTALGQIMGYRAVDTSKLKGEQKKFYEKMKKQHALKETKRYKTAQERENDFVAKHKKRKGVG